jgi:hypothetical protein
VTDGVGGVVLLGGVGCSLLYVGGIYLYVCGCFLPEYDVVDYVVAGVVVEAFDEFFAVEDEFVSQD